MCESARETETERERGRQREEEISFFRIRYDMCYMSFASREKGGGGNEREVCRSVSSGTWRVSGRKTSEFSFFFPTLIWSIIFFFFISFADVGRPHSSSWAMRAICRTSSLVFNLLAILALPGTKKKEYQY